MNFYDALIFFRCKCMQHPFLQHLMRTGNSTVYHSTAYSMVKRLLLCGKQDELPLTEQNVGELVSTYHFDMKI